MRMSISLTASALVLSVSLAGCANTGNVGNAGNIGGWCEDEPFLCILVAAGVIGLGIWAVNEWDDDDDSNPSTLESTASDLRLKRDVRDFRTLPNGVKLYTFRYWNDERTFVGVVAQDLLKEERFRHAVSVSDNGYYLVNYRAIGVGIPQADRPLYEQASRKALQKN
jgi:hypothetical protein